jgi:putative flippase GtrA
MMSFIASILIDHVALREHPILRAAPEPSLYDRPSLYNIGPMNDKAKPSVSEEERAGEDAAATVGEGPRGLPGLFHTLFKKKSTQPMVEFFRYFVVSGASFIFDFGLLYILTDKAHIHYLISAAISYGTGMIVSYLLSIKWAFGRRSLNSKAAEFGIFVAIGIAGMGINSLILWIWTGLLGLYYMLGRIVSAIIGYIWKYIARKFTLFK